MIEPTTPTAIALEYQRPITSVAISPSTMPAKHPHALNTDSSEDGADLLGVTFFIFPREVFTATRAFAGLPLNSFQTDPASKKSDT